MAFCGKQVGVRRLVGLLVFFSDRHIGSTREDYPNSSLPEAIIDGKLGAKFSASAST